MKAFQDALIHDLNADDFADMYAQTIAYGLLSARIANPSAGRDSQAIELPVTNPFLKELLLTFMAVGGGNGVGGGLSVDFDELGVGDVVQLLDDANMEAVVRDFGDQNPEEDPVIHFYELFLKEYDARKRMQRGVFYTPRPVVSYIVRSTDEVLRTEFGLEDGLADTATWGEMANRNRDLAIPAGVSPEDPFVQILDPATGTGTFLVEVIDVIHRRMSAKWYAEGRSANTAAQLWNEYVPKHLLPRLHGYELLMAPYAIAHVKVGLKLYETGYRFGSDERVRIYLTNSLEPAGDTGQMSLVGFLPALAHEALAVNKIKQHQPFTVIVGNPPYSALSANLTPANRRVVDRYRSVDGERIRERSMLQFEKNIQDDYIKFFALSQGIIDRAAVGVLGFVSNHSYIDGPTLRGMRWSLLGTFDRIDLTDLHGNANKKEGVRGDENVFDIRQGVSIALLRRTPATRSADKRRHVSHMWGPRAAKYQQLLNQNALATPGTEISPAAPSYYFVAFQSGLGDEYGTFLPITAIFTKNLTGTTTGFDDLLVGFDRDELTERIREFADPAKADDELAASYGISGGQAEKVLDLRTSIDEATYHALHPPLRASAVRRAMGIPPEGSSARPSF